MTVCDEWMRQKRRGVYVRHCITEVSEEREKESINKGGRGEKRGWVHVGLEVGVVAHELHTKAPTCTLPLHLCPACQACRVLTRECVCVFVFVCALAHVRACVCKAEVG